MSNIITGRQLRAARILAGLTPKTIGSSSRRSRTRRALEKIEAVLRTHGVIVFATPTAGVRLATDVAAHREIRDQN